MTVSEGNTPAGTEKISKVVEKCSLSWVSPQSVHAQVRLAMRRKAQAAGRLKLSLKLGSCARGARDRNRTTCVTLIRWAQFHRGRLPTVGS